MERPLSIYYPQAERAPDSTPHQGVGGEPAVGGEPPINPVVGGQLVDHPVAGRVIIPPWDPEYGSRFSPVHRRMQPGVAHVVRMSRCKELPEPVTYVSQGERVYVVALKAQCNEEAAVLRPGPIDVRIGTDDALRLQQGENILVGHIKARFKSRT